MVLDSDEFTTYPGGMLVHPASDPAELIKGLGWVIYSDSHRANAWKGGQLCVGAMDGSSVKLSHPGGVTMQRVVARAWGMPPPNLNTIMFCEWFNHRAAHRKIAQLHTLQSVAKSSRP